MKNLVLSLATWTLSMTATAQINLIIRADDLGSFHAANTAIIDGAREGIITSIEVMTCTPWYPEAIEMLKSQDTTTDVGVHLMLTSEWSKVKWRPMTQATSLVDENGYFFPFMEPRNEMEKAFPSLKNNPWRIEEIEKEFRAQIESVLKNTPRVSHVSTHMGCANINPEVVEMVNRICKEYGLTYVNALNLPRVNAGINITDPISVWEDKFIDALNKLTDGTYLFVEHPAYATDEMSTVGHIGYTNVAEHRQKVYELFTSQRVRQAIQQKGIQLISFKDYVNMKK